MHVLSSALLTAALIAHAAPGPGQSPSPVRPAASRADAYTAEFEKARTLLRRHEYFEALKGFQRANGLSGGKSAECYVGMAEAMVGMKTWPNVLETGRTALELAADQPMLRARAHVARGQAFQALGAKDEAKLGEAEREFRAALEADPGSRTPDLHYNLGVVLMKQSKDEAGIAELKKEIEQRANGSTADDARALIANPRRAREDFAPDFEVEAADGRKLTLESLKGKVFLLDFWSGTCPPCASSIPALRKLRQAHPDSQLEIISIVTEGDLEAWKTFTKKNSMTWPQVMDDRRVALRAFDVRDVPTYVLVDAEGVVRMRVSHTGFKDAKELTGLIERLLALGGKGPA